MSLHRYDAARDKNEPEIVHALRQVGAYVALINGTGVPDLLVGYKGETFLLEVKLPLLEAHTPTGKVRTDKARMKGRELKPAQEHFFSAWRGGHVCLVRTIRQALWAISACDEATEDLNDGLPG